MEYALMIDTRNCVGCNACEVACKQEHNLPVGPRWIKVFPDAPKEIEGRVQLRYVVTHCMHCSQPQCQKVCSAGAITKRADGIVLIDEALCIGCKECIEACPLGAMCFDEEKAVVAKCDLCVHRIDSGLQPACAAACPAHCIYFGDAGLVARRLGKQGLLIRYKAVTQ